jgi:signal transduction histidine kinase
MIIMFIAASGRAQLPESSVFLNRLDTTAVLGRIKLASQLHSHYPDSARTIAEEALKKCRQYNYPNGIRNALYELASNHYYNKNFRQSIERSKELITVSDKKLQPILVCRAYLIIGMSFEALEDYQNALEAYQQALSTEADAEHKSYVYNNISSVLFNIGQYDKAEYYLDKAFAISPSPSSILLYKKAYIYNLAKDIPNAIKFFDSAYTVAEKDDEKANILFRKILFLSESKSGAAALEHYNRYAPELMMDGKISPMNRAHLLLAAGSAYFSLTNYNLAKKHLLEAKELISHLGQPEKRKLLHSLSDLYYATHDYKQAYDLHKLVHQLQDSVKRGDILYKVNELETKYRTAQKDRNLAIEQALNSEHRKNKYRNELIGGALVATLLLITILLGSRYYLQKQKLKQLRAEKELEKLQATLQGEEKERLRLSHELHDGVNSSLAATTSYLQVMGHQNPQLTTQPPYIKVSQLLAATSSEIRAIAHNLAPHILISKGLFYAIEAFCHNLFPMNIQVDIQTIGKEHLLPKETALFVYRITQELLHNVHKHAQANQVLVWIEITDDDLTVQLADNGIGFSEKQQQVGIGLKNIKQKIASYSGTFVIKPRNEGGTFVQIIIPLQKTK